MNGSERAHKHRRRRPLHRRKSVLFALILTASLLIVAYAVLNTSLFSADHGAIPRGALIDQLNSSFPNKTFWFSANYMFNQSGWRLHYFMGSIASDTVDFYRTLPERGFRIILLRVHAALSPSTGTLALFTSEEWDDWKASSTYLPDFDLISPENNKLAKVRVNDTAEAYFGITPSFVRAMQGDFRGAIVIMMGCDGMANKKMAEAFIEKGASAYIGWSGPVSASHTDAATQLLLKFLVSEKKSVEAAVGETLDQMGDDPAFGSTMSYYPSDAGQYRIQT